MLRSILNFLCPGKIANEYIYGKLLAFVNKRLYECPHFHGFFFSIFSFSVSFKSFENFHLTWRLQSAFLLCNSATSTDRFHLKLLQLIQTNVQRAFFKRWSLVKQLDFFFAINCQENNFLNASIRDWLWNFAASADLLLPKSSESYSFRCLNKPILNEKFYQIFCSKLIAF